MTGPRATSRGMRGMFWTWLSVVAIGLVVMIALPLLGR